MAPNTGVHGYGVNEAALLRAANEKGILFIEDEELRLVVKRITLACDESSIPSQSKSGGSHMAWMIVSDQVPLNTSVGVSCSVQWEDDTSDNGDDEVSIVLISSWQSTAHIVLESDGEPWAIT